VAASTSISATPSAPSGAKSSCACGFMRHTTARGERGATSAPPTTRLKIAATAKKTAIALTKAGRRRRPITSRAPPVAAARLNPGDARVVLGDLRQVHHILPEQKVVVAKWLSHNSDIFIFDEPTAGVDVGAKMEIYKLKSHAAGLSIQCVRLQVSPGVPILC
jgi:hypothetical protein